MQNVADTPLFPLEAERFHSEFKTYFKHKRANFFKALSDFSGMWECFQLLNDIWMREMEDLQVLTDDHHMLPRMLFTAAHAKLLSAIELGFACCIDDSYSLLRDAIEFTTHAYKIFSDPSATEIWAERMHGKSHSIAYDNLFTHNKKKNLFPDKFGLAPLHKYYAQLSEIGAHSNATSLGMGFKDASTAERRSWQYHYFETDPRNLAIFLFAMLAISCHIEETFFGTFELRLSLDNDLLRKRAEFATRKQQERGALKLRYKLGNP